MLKTKIAKFLPDKFKAIIRPIYKKIFQGVRAEKATNLKISSFDGFDIAFREGTTYALGEDHSMVRLGWTA